MKKNFVLPFVGLSLTSLAATVTFTGEKSGYFSDSANWKDGVLPASGDYIVIENVAGSAATNDIDGLVLSGITFNGVGTGGPTGSGDNNNFNLRGKKITFLPDSTFFNTKNVHFYQQAEFEIPSGTLTFSATNNGRFDNYANISGAGKIVCGSGRYYSYYSNNYTGGTSFTGGGMGIFRNDSLGLGDVTVEQDRTITFYNDRGVTTYLNNFLIKGTTGNSTVNIDFRGSTIFKGIVTIESKNRIATIENQVNDTVTFEKQVQKPKASGDFILNQRSGDKLVFKEGVNAPGSTMWHDTVGEVHFDGGTSSFNLYRLSNGGVYFNAPFTVPEEAELRFVGDGTSVFSFTGNQCVKKISSFEGKGQNSILTAQGEATLVVKATSSENYNSKITGPLSFVWYPTGNYKFSALNECSFSGALVVSNGTFEALNEISSLTNISSLVVSSGASLILGEEVKINNRLEKLDVSRGATLSFADEQNFVVDDLLIDGVAQTDNVTYTGGTGNGSTVIHLDCLPANVSVFVKMKPVAGIEYEWTGTGGVNNAFEYNANWKDGFTPPLNPNTLPVFTGGSSAVLNQSVELNGIKNTQDAAFDFGAQENVCLKLFWGGVNLEGDGTAAREFAFNMPVVIGGEQIWNTAKNKRIIFNGPISDDAEDVYGIVKDGAGFVYLNAKNTFKGDLHITNGVVVVGENGTLGDSENGAVVIDYLKARGDSQKIQLKPGAKITRPIKISQDGDYWSHYYVGPVTSGSGSCEIASLITMADTGVYRLGNPSSSITTIFSGGASNGTFYVQSRGDTIVTNKPLNVFKFYLDARANLYIFSPSNILSATGGNASVIASPLSKVHIMTNDAIVSPRHRITMRNGGTLDLHGHDLTVESVCTAGTVGTNAIVRSDAPACITMNLEGALESYTTFEGAVSLKKYGRFSYTNDSKTLGDKTLNTSTGRIEVVEGNFILGPNQRWIGEKVVLSGATAKFITRAGAELSRKTDLEINASGAKLELAADSVVTCAVFRVNGVKQPTGTWGATTSSAQYKNDTLFATVGSGTLVVLGDGKGLILTLR